MNKEVQIRNIEVSILKVSAKPEGISLLYTVGVYEAFMSDEQKVQVIYPNADELYSIGNISKKIGTIFERPVQVNADGTINMNQTATNLELLESQTLELQDICEEIDIFGKVFDIPVNISTTDYTEDKGGIKIWDDELFKKSLLTKNRDISGLINSLIDKMKGKGLINTMANSDKKKTVGKIKTLLDSLFPACDIEMRFPEKAIMESSSKVGKALQRVLKLSANNKFTWKLSVDPDIDFGLDTALALVGTDTENPEQRVVFSYNTYPDYALTEETHLAYNSAPQEGEALTGFKDVDDMINSVNEWQKLGNEEHPILDNYSEPPMQLVDDFKFWVKEYSK